MLERRWKNGDATHIAAELRRWFGMLFMFLQRHNVPWHNNRAENAIRQGVLHRKISGGGRTWNGAHVLECIMSVYRTCRKKKQDFKGNSPVITGKRGLQGKNHSIASAVKVSSYD